MISLKVLIALSKLLALNCLDQAKSVFQVSNPGHMGANLFGLSSSLSSSDKGFH